MEPTYTMEQLWFMTQCGMFKNDMRKEMRELGFPDDVIFAFILSDGVRDKNICLLWQDVGRHYPTYFHTYFEKYAKLK